MHSSVRLSLSLLPISISNENRLDCLEIRQEISKIENGEYDKQNNPLKNAPHSQHVLVKDKWTLPYSLKTAVYPAVRVKRAATAKKTFLSLSRASFRLITNFGLPVAE